MGDGERGLDELQSIGVGQEVEVRLPNLMSFTAKIKRFDEARVCLHVERPPVRVISFLYAGLNVNVLATLGDGLLLFDSTVEEVAETYVSLLGASGLRNSLKRKYYRLPEQAAIRLIYGARAYELDCSTFDLSGGGFRLSVSSARLFEPLQTGTIVEFKLFLMPANRPIRGAAKVVWARTQKTNLLLGMEFTTILEQDRNLIVKHLLKRQAELRRLGLL